MDNMFVIVNAFDKTNACLSINERLSKALQTSGTSITVTSLTNLLAFMIGAQTSLPVLRAFAFYAALGIFCNYVLQVNKSMIGFQMQWHQHFLLIAFLEIDATIDC